MNKEQGQPGLGGDQGPNGAEQPETVREAGGAAGPAPAEPAAEESAGRAAGFEDAGTGPRADGSSRLAPPSGFASPDGSFAASSGGPAGSDGAQDRNPGDTPGNHADAGAQNPAKHGGPYVVAGYPASARPLTSYDRPSGNPYAGIPASGKTQPGGSAPLPPYPPAGAPTGSARQPGAGGAGAGVSGGEVPGGFGPGAADPGPAGPSSADPAAGAPEDVRPPYGMPEQSPQQYAAADQYPQQYAAAGQAPQQYAMPGQGTPGGYGPGYPGTPGSQGPGYPGYPGSQGYPGYQGYPGTQPARTPGKALGIAALSVAGAGLIISWLPFFNVFTFVLGAVALGLGIPALIKGFRARNVARVLGIVALAVAVLSMIIAGSVTALIVDSFRQSSMGQYDAESDPQPVRPLPNASGSPDALASPDEYTFEISDSFMAKVLSAPAVSAGDEVQVGDYTVTLVSVDGNASAEVQERDPSAGAPDHNYVIFEFTTVYNGDGEGRLWLDLAPEFIGADSRSYSVLDCSMDLGVNAFDQPNLKKGDTRTYEFCMDLPDEAIGEDSRTSLRMILADNNEPVYWRLP